MPVVVARLWVSLSPSPPLPPPTHPSSSALFLVAFKVFLGEGGVRLTPPPSPPRVQSIATGRGDGRWAIADTPRCPRHSDDAHRVVRCSSGWLGCEGGSVVYLVRAILLFSGGGGGSLRSLPLLTSAGSAAASAVPAHTHTHTHLPLHLPRGTVFGGPTLLSWALLMWW